MSESKGVIVLPTPQKISSMTDSQQLSYLKDMAKFAMKNVPQQIKKTIASALKEENKQTLTTLIATYAPTAFGAALSAVLWKMSDMYVEETPVHLQFEIEAEGQEAMKLSGLKNKQSKKRTKRKNKRSSKNTKKKPKSRHR